MSFLQVVHVLLQEKCLDYFDQTFLKATNRDLSELCKHTYAPPTTFKDQLYITLYKWLYINARKKRHLSMYIQYNPLYTVINDNAISVGQTIPTDQDVLINTKYQSLIVASTSTNKEHLYGDICDLDPKDDILFTFMSNNIAICELVADTHALLIKHDKNIKISIFLK